MSIDIGDIPSLAVKIVDTAGIPANAGAVVCTITLPDGSVVTPTVDNPTTGTYAVSYITTQAGVHRVRWVATGVNASAFSDTFSVRNGASLDFISLADARASLKVPATDTTHDEMLRDYIDAVTAVIEDMWGQVVGRTWTEQHYGGVYAISLNQQPIASITSVTEYRGATAFPLTQAVTPDVAVTDSYTFNAQAGTIQRRTSGGYPMAFIGEVWVVYKSGTPQIPGNVLLAARELLRHLYQLGQQAGSRPAFGTIPQDDAVYTPSGFAIPRRVAELLGSPSIAPGFA